MQQPGSKGRRRGSSKRTDAARVAVRHVLSQLFEAVPGEVDDSRTLSDLEGCRLLHVTEPVSSAQWRIRVKERIYACFGVSCDLDEPLADLVARIELAERGVGCTFTH